MPILPLPSLEAWRNWTSIETTTVDGMLLAPPLSLATARLGGVRRTHGSAHAHGVFDVRLRLRGPVTMTSLCLAVWASGEGEMFGGVWGSSWTGDGSSAAVLRVLATMSLSFR